MSTVPPPSSTVPRVDGVGRRGAADDVGERLLGDGVEVRRDRVGQAVDPELDPVVEGKAGLLAEVLDRPLELARVALGTEVVGQLGVDDDDEALVVGDGGARPRAWPGSRPRRRRG